MTPLAAQTTLPGFKTVCTSVAFVYVFLASSMVLQGAKVAMAPFGLPQETLDSPHFADFFHWVFVHMVVLGVLIGLLGRYVERGEHQRTVARVLFLIEAHYTYLDLRTSDSPLGNALYHGPRTLIPPAVDLIVLLAFAYLGTRSLKPSQA
ncbi:MAG: hypothetical protein QM778_15500 [Myxococcales bacterium]